MNCYYVTLKDGGSVCFVGKYLPEMENECWHCYEDNKGSIYYFYKPNINYVKASPVKKNDLG